MEYFVNFNHIFISVVSISSKKGSCQLNENRSSLLIFRDIIYKLTNYKYIIKSLQVFFLFKSTHYKNVQSYSNKVRSYTLPNE